MTDKEKAYWIFAGSFVFTAIVCGFLLAGYMDCNEAGGQYVRGLFWMECVL